MQRAEVISELLKRANLTPPDLLAADVAAALGDAGGNHLVIYVVDYEQVTLQPVALATELLDVRPEGVTIAGTMAGRAFQRQEVVSAETPGGWRVWAPLVERAERVGVLELGFATVDEELLPLCEDLGRLVGHLLHTAGRYTDLVDLRRRRRDMSLAAEMQWDMLLPPLAFRSPEVGIAGLLEPAYEVAGDGFDYSLDGETLTFLMIDAMGHGLRATLASTLALAAFRHARRSALGLAEIAHCMDRALASEFDGDTFVTGHIGSLDTATGRFRWVNAGHPPPLLARGSKVVAELACAPCYPLGLGILEPEIGECQLEPGDALLFYSDGVIEARPALDRGDQFGVDRLKDLLERNLGMGLVASEVLRRTAAAVVEHRADRLEDDATLVVLEWRPAS
ncbi:MAG: PP2C family protein-serine/threonine phosphatase [Acidimicrobiales bacterium]